MSTTAREWALRQALAPVHKFVLVVLADAADDQGICWPRISTVAEKVGVSTRTVQRAVQHLTQKELVTVEPRKRSDGSSSSNLYRLRLREGVNLSPPPDKVTSSPDRMTPPPVTGVTHPRHRCQGEGDARVTPLTERRTEREPPPRKPMPNIESGIPDRGGGIKPGLHWPKDLLPSERIRAEAMISRVAPPLNQQVLDEWAAIIAADDIRSSPLGCLRALIERAWDGKFTPERGLWVAQAREAKRRAEDRVAKLPELAPPNPDSPLVRRLQNMAQRQGKR
ncbi:MAG: helix-turn-helix domain-containing protein [Gammaproteobacteria bacterium]|nr:helix-turn-helix domain-containing protein [Gammaproteobacteria bacterium]MDE0412526.1 helix-turn-helix domain-containing protein [Gammaproteobacteria bacterium]